MSVNLLSVDTITARSFDRAVISWEGKVCVDRPGTDNTQDGSSYLPLRFDSATLRHRLA